MAGVYPDGSSCSGCVNTVDPSYDLVKNKIVTYVPTGNKTCASSALRPSTIKAESESTGGKPLNKMPAKP